MIEYDQNGRPWLHCDFCKQQQRRIYTADGHYPRQFEELYFCETCRDKVEYLMDNFAHIERLIERQ